MRQRCRPGQPKPMSIQQQHSGHRLQCTKHRQHSSSSIMGGPGTGGSYPSMPCKPCACVIIVQQITSFVSEVADAGAQAFPTRRSLLTSRRPSVTALLLAAGCWLLAAALLSLLRSRCWLYTGRPEAEAGTCRSVAFFRDSLPPLTPLLHFPLFAPSQHTSACIRQSSKRHRASCSAEAHAAAAAVARLVLDHVAPGSQPTTD